VLPTYTDRTAGEPVKLTLRGKYVTNEEGLICGKGLSYWEFCMEKRTGSRNMQMQPRSLGNKTWHPVVWGYTKYDHR